MTITIGPKNADLVGTTDRVIQAAVDYVARRGGGTVRVLPGTYRQRNSVFLQSNVASGKRGDSVLFRALGPTKLIVDGDRGSGVTWRPQRVSSRRRRSLVAKDPHGKGTTLFSER